MLEYLKGENRYASLANVFPEKADRLYEKTIQEAKDRYDRYRKLSEN